jgi:glycine cleavage system aminomethyltransferase T
VHVVVGGRDVLVAEQVADAHEVAGALRELGRQAVPQVVGADLRGALRLEAGSERGLSERVTAVELREDRTLVAARRIEACPGAS